MIYFGNNPVNFAMQLIGDGYKFKRVKTSSAMTAASELKSLILNNLGNNVDAFGINASVFGNYDDLINQYVMGFFVQIRSGDFTTQCGFIRKNTGNAPQFTVGWSTTYGAKTAADDEFLIVYKEVA